MLADNRSAAAIDAFGYPVSKLTIDRQLGGDGFTFYRRAGDGSEISRIQSGPRGRGYVIAVSQSDGHRRIVHGPRRTPRQFCRHSIAIRNRADPYAAELEGRFDFLIMEVSQDFLEGLSDQRGWSQITLSCSADHVDPLLSNLMRAALSDPGGDHGCNRLFIDHLGRAIGTYLLDHYAGETEQALGARPLLSRKQLTVAKELMQHDREAPALIEELAAACGLSRGYFIHAFKRTTGVTPHRWLQLHRVERARQALLQTDLTLAEIALNCGFADQSHFTRVFARVMGSPPGNWRRTAQGCNPC